MSQSLPERPNLDHLREQAKDLLRDFRAGQALAIERMAVGLPELALKGALNRPPALHDAQSALAREYGFASWRALVQHVEEVRAREGITQSVIDAFVEAALSDRAGRMERLLELYPALPKASLLCGLLCGESETFRRWLDEDPSRVQAPIGPHENPPIAMAVRSRIHRLSPERAAGQLACVRLLLDRGVGVNETLKADPPYDFQLPVLYWASGDSGHIGVVRELLERGANPNDGESVYHAAEHNRREILELLLQHGADLSGVDKTWGNTPLTFLCNYRDAEAQSVKSQQGIAWLLEHGADPNVRKREDGENALHVACRRGRSRQLIEMLLAHGADPNIPRTDGKTPYELAAIAGAAGAMEALVEAGAEPLVRGDDAFLAQCAVGHIAKIEAMLADDPDLLQRTEPRARELSIQFAEQGVESGLVGLFAAGYAFLREYSGEVMTPLHFSAFVGSLPCVRRLLDYGMSSLIRDDEHHSTPFGWAVFASVWNRNPSGDYPGVVSALLQAGTPREDALRELDYEEVPEDVKTVIRNYLTST